LKETGHPLKWFFICTRLNDFEFRFILLNKHRLTVTKTLLLIAVFCIKNHPVSAQADTIRPSDQRLITAQLKPGIRQYIVYYQNPPGNKNLFCWFWIREVTSTEWHHQTVFTITQHWFGTDTNVYRKIFSVNRKDDFQPLYHAETKSSKLSAYIWTENKITGDSTVKNNTKAGFTLLFQDPNFNWNLDMEIFEMLPLAAGKSFLINFYDAGLEPPKYILYTVTGSESLPTYEDHSVDCWKLFTEGSYNGVHYSENYWISKKDHECLKEEDVMGKTYRYKIKLPSSAYNIMSRFAGETDMLNK
jgi:hypothetical protein